MSMHWTLPAWSLAALATCGLGHLTAAETTPPGITSVSGESGAAMFAYSEFELAGEPLAEALGLDLDILDPDRVGEPTPFDYAAGIEAYEYSEEAMYALLYQSRQGPHLGRGPLNAARGGDSQSLAIRLAALAASVGVQAEEYPANLHPVSLAWHGVDPSLAGAVDAGPVPGSEQSLAIRDATGAERTVAIHSVRYQHDFASLGWRDSPAVISPVALGGCLLKEVLWAQDFLGGLHTVADDAEVAAESADQDRDPAFALGVSAADGLNGVLLTEISHDKLLLTRDRLIGDGERLGLRPGPAYDGTRPLWIPSRIIATLHGEAADGRALAGLTIADAASSLRGTWLLLWSLGEWFAFTDQRTAARPAGNPAFHAVFDGSPFAAAPAANRNRDRADDVAGDDPFSLGSELLELTVVNLMTLHRDAESGAFVDRWHPATGPGRRVSTFDNAYALTALRIYSRAVDALPVGYAADAGGAGLGTARGQRATAALIAAADHLLAELIDPDSGLARAGRDLDGQAGGPGSLADQFAVLRGLSDAFLVTGDERYRNAARELYLAVERQRFDPVLGIYSDRPGAGFTIDIWTAGAVAGGLRAALLTLANRGAEASPELERGHLAARSAAWFATVINGRGQAAGLQLSEWPGDTGEHASARPDSDADGVARPEHRGYAPTLAGGLHLHP